MAYVSVTEREGATVKGQPGEGAAVDPEARARVGARTRGRIVSAARSVTQRAQSRRVAPQPAKRVDPYADVLTDTEADAPAVRGRSLWNDGAASPADQWEYLRAGAWAPGEQHRLVEAVAKLYGLLVLALTVVVTVPLWLAQRPSRTALAVVVGLIWWAATRADAAGGAT